MTLRRYESYICDSARWDGFEHRAGDIVVTTPPKCGTTWMQMCCLVLVHGPVLPEPLSVLAPWLDQTVAQESDVRAHFAAQRHRRVIKTHTPLDGLPLSDLATYVCVGRDPRDVAFSSADHFRNMDVDALRRLKEQAGLEEGPPVRPPHPEDPQEAFLQWLDDNAPVERIGSRLSFIVHHLRTVWARRHQPKVELFHYADLRCDPEGQLRRLASAIGIAVEESQWPALVEATSFESMRAHADVVAPNAVHGLWRDSSRFFAEGRQGSWRTLLSDAAIGALRAAHRRAMPRPPAPTVTAQGVDVIEPDGPESTYAKLPSALVHRCDKRRSPLRPVDPPSAGGMRRSGAS